MASQALARSILLRTSRTSRLPLRSVRLIPYVGQSLRAYSTKEKTVEVPAKNPPKELIHKEDAPITELTPTENTPAASAPPAGLKAKVMGFLSHMWGGTKLLMYELKVSTKLLVKILSGYALSRRESNQLQRTIGDLGRLIPFSMFLIIPFAELLLPIALKIFPNLLPSTYESSLDIKKKRAKLAENRKTASNFIQKTLDQEGLKLSKKISETEKQAFVSFFDIISNGQTPSKQHLIQVAQMFKNDQVLDNLSRNQLVAMAKYMSLRPFGTDAILRYQIRHRLLTIIKDDKAIDYEGIDSLTVPELQIACSQRGIKTQDVSPGRLRDDLLTWLDLRLRQKIPSTLLILSSVYTYGEHKQGIETYYDALLAVLSSIPDEVYNVAKLELAHDNKLKLDILKEQDEMINEENIREKDTVNKIKDEIKLDEYEETSSDGIKVEPEEAETEGQKPGEEVKSEEVKDSETAKSESETPLEHKK